MAWDLMIGNNILQEFLSGADALMLETVSMRQPLGKQALRKRALLRFPRIDDGFSYSIARTEGMFPESRLELTLHQILSRYSAVRILDVVPGVSIADATDPTYRLVSTLLCVLARAPLPHLRELRLPDNYVSVERFMICHDYPRLLVTPALDASVEQLLAAGYACGDREDYPWNIYRCHQHWVGNETYTFSAIHGTGGYSAKLLSLGPSPGGTMYYAVRIRTPDKDIKITWLDANSPLRGKDLDLIDGKDRELAIEYQEYLMEWFRNAAFAMILNYMQDREAHRVQITITPLPARLGPTWEDHALA